MRGKRYAPARVWCSCTLGLFIRVPTSRVRSPKGSRKFWRVKVLQIWMRPSAAAQRSGAPLPAKDKLIIALDFDTPARALDLVPQLKSVAGMFKVGSRLFTAGGPQIVKDILNLDAKVFLDLKFHDIPH